MVQGAAMIRLTTAMMASVEICMVEECPGQKQLSRKCSDHGKGKAIQSTFKPGRIDGTGLLDGESVEKTSSVLLIRK